MNKNQMTSPALEDVFGIWHETTLRVRYSETDKMGIVYYANYLVWFEIGRAEYCRARGFSYRDMEENDDALRLHAQGESEQRGRAAAAAGAGLRHGQPDRRARQGRPHAGWRRPAIAEPR